MNRLLAAHTLGVLGLACIGVTTAAIFLDPVLFVPGAVVSLLLSGSASLFRGRTYRYFGASLALIFIIGFLVVHYTNNEGFIAPSLVSMQDFSVAMLVPAVVALPFGVLLALRLYHNRSFC